MNEKPSAYAQPSEPHAPVEQVKDHAHETAAEFRATGKAIKEEATRKAADVMHDMKEELHDIADEACSFGTRLIRSKKQALADRVHEYGEAAQAAANKLREEGRDSMADRLNDTAEQIEKTSRYLRDRDSDEILADVQNYARKRPEIVYGGMFLAGLALARLLKASGRRARSRSEQVAERTPANLSKQDPQRSFPTHATDSHNPTFPNLQNSVR